VYRLRNEGKMSKVAGVLTQAQFTAVCKGAFKSGAKQATVEITLPNGTMWKVTASAEADPMAINRPAEANEWDELTGNGAN